jgi:hypothetical protein
MEQRYYQAIEKQQGILVERATNVYSFSHLTLQEYLAAFFINNERLEDHLIAKHLVDERWREIFLLTTGLLGNKAIDFLGNIASASNLRILNYEKITNLTKWAHTKSTDPLYGETLFLRRANALNYAVLVNDVKCSAGLYEINLEFTISMDLKFLRMRQATASIESELMSDIAFRISVSISFARYFEAIVQQENDLSNSFKSREDNGKKDNSINTLIAFLPQAIAQYFGAVAISAKKLSEKKSSILFERIEKAYVEIPDSKVLPSSESLSAGFYSNWGHWAHGVQLIWLDFLGLDEQSIELNIMEANALKDYFSATELLLRCKDAAVRIPKQAWADLEARLLTV